MIMSNKQKKEKIILLIEMICLAFPAISFLYFSIIPQYEIRDHEGYLAGAIVLAGYISFIMITNLIKEVLGRVIMNWEEYAYIFSICNVVMSFICIKVLLFYYARVYLLSLFIFWCIGFAYIVIRQITIKVKKPVTIGFKTVLCLSGIVSVLSTIIRGIYLFRWQVFLTLVALFITGIVGLIQDKRDSNDIYFPYDFSLWKEEVRANYIKKYKTVIVIVLSLVVLYLFLGPLEIYAGNMLSFSFGYKTFLPLFVLIGIITVIFLSAIIALFTEKTFKLICVMLTSISLLSYIQCMFMNTKLMEEDGARLRLDTMGIYPTVNLVLWIIIAIAVATALYAIKNKWKTVAMGMCAFISAVQMVAVVSLVITCINAPAPRYYQLTGDSTFTVAKEENVIVLVPDSFCRRYLDEIVDDNPDCMDLFKDFTYYDNMDSEYHPTFPSFIHFITGYEAPDGLASGLSKERVQWQTDAWNSDRCKSFFEETREKGYEFFINIPSACELLGAYDDVCDKVGNAEYAESNVDRPLLLKMLFSMSIYRCVPYVIKPPFEYFSWDFAELERYTGKVAAYRNEDFYSEALNGITIDDSIDKKINVINWHGFHEEYTNDEYCNSVPNAESEGITMLQNGKGVLLCVDAYLNDLKKIDMYDSSTIIVMGDHGKMYDGCVFVKRPHENHDKVIVNKDAKIYGDFQATILNIIGDEKYADFGQPWIE